MNIRFFSLQDWRIDKEIIMTHIPGTLNLFDDLTKGLAYVLHACHNRRKWAISVKPFINLYSIAEIWGYVVF